MILTRRKLIGGMGLLFAAPAIVRASSLMPVKPLATTEEMVAALIDSMERTLSDVYQKAFYDFMVFGEAGVMVGPDEIRHISVAHTQVPRWVDIPTAAGESAA